LIEHGLTSTPTKHDIGFTADGYTVFS